MRPETREPGSSRSPAGVVVGNRPLAGARWRDRRSAPQRGFCSRKRTNVCGRRGVGLFARASLSILSSAAPLSVVRALSRADSGEARWDRRPRAGFSCAGRHGEGQRLQGLRLLAASSGAGPDGPKLFNRHHPIDGRCHMDLFKMLGTLEPGQSLFLNRPVAGRRCRTGALGAVAGTADAKACVRGAGGVVFAFSRGRHSTQRSATPRSAERSVEQEPPHGRRRRRGSRRSVRVLDAAAGPSPLLVQAARMASHSSASSPLGELAARRAGGGPAASLRVGAGDRSRAGKRGGRPVARRADENGAMTPRIGTGRS